MTTARTPRAGMAMLLALVSILVFAAIGSAALAAARMALHRAGESHLELRDQLARDGVRARVAAMLEHMPAAGLSSAPAVVAAPDTQLHVTALGQGWYRLSVRHGDREVSAELARTSLWNAPCQAVITAGELIAPDGVPAPDPGVTCPHAAATLPVAAFDSLVSVWQDALVRAALPDTLRLSAASPPAPAVWRATAVIVVETGAMPAGVLWAPEVIVRPAASVRGLILARDRVAIAPSALVVAGPLETATAWGRVARLHPLGRRGLLAPP